MTHREITNSWRCVTNQEVDGALMQLPRPKKICKACCTAVPSDKGDIWSIGVCISCLGVYLHDDKLSRLQHGSCITLLSGCVG
jgi:hypothetical protein